MYTINKSAQTKKSLETYLMILIYANEELTCRKNHFKEYLNIAFSQDSLVIDDIQILYIAQELINWKKIGMAVKMMKSRKALGVDAITLEVIMASGEAKMEKCNTKYFH